MLLLKLQTWYWVLCRQQIQLASLAEGSCHCLQLSGHAHRHLQLSPATARNVWGHLGMHLQHQLESHGCLGCYHLLHGPSSLQRRQPASKEVTPQVQEIWQHVVPGYCLAPCTSL